MASKTKLRGNQINIRDVFNHPDAAATTERTGAVEIATQAEVLAGSPIGVVVTTDTLKNHPGLDELKDMYVTSGSPSDTLHSDKLLFNLEVNSSNVFTAEELPDYGYDAASVTYASKTASFTPVNGNDMGSAFIRPDGMAVYIVDSDVDPGTVKEYLLGTAWDISTKSGSVNSSLVMSSGDHVNDMRGIWFNEDGTKAIVSGSTQWAEYSFSTAYDLTTATFIQAVNDIGESTGASALSFSEDGSYAYRIRRAFSANQWYIASYSVGTPWDVSTISLISQNDEITSETGINQPYGVTVNQDGTKLFVVHDNNAETSGTSKIREYSLATPYLVSSRTLAASSVQSQSRYLRYMFWSPLGTDLYMLDNAANIYQYTSSAVDLGGLTTSMLHDGIARIQTKGTGAVVNGILEISGTNAQLTLTTAALPTTNITAAVLYDTDDDSPKFYAGSPTGWVKLLPGVTIDSLDNIFTAGTNAGASLDTSTNDNILLGRDAGTLLSGNSANSNILMGFSAGANMTNSASNIGIGNYVFDANTTSSRASNTAVGHFSGRYMDANNNTFIGYQAGRGNSGTTPNLGFSNTFVGHTAGGDIEDGDYNVGVGFEAGRYLKGNRNTAIGQWALGGYSSNVTGSHNVAVGERVSAKMTSGSYNAAFGYYAGYNITTGTGNICIGRDAGPLTNTSNQLFIGTGNHVGYGSDDMLIHGDMTAKTLEINGALEEHGVFEVHATHGAIGQGEIRIWDDTDTGHTTGNYVALKPPSPVGSPTSANWTLTLPIDAGTSEQVLITDGAGNTSWSANAISTLYSDATQIGSDKVVSGSFHSIEAFTSTDIVHVNFEVDSLQTYRFDGSTWTAIGTAYDLGTIVPRPQCMGALNTTDVAVANFSAGTIQTYRFDASGSPAATWAPVGGTYSISGIETGLCMIALNSTDVVYYNSNSDNIRTLRFTGGSPGGTWSQIGNAFSITDAVQSMVRLNDTDIAVIESTTDTIQTYTFNGTDWSTVGNSLDLGNANSMTGTDLTSTDIVILDSAADVFKTFRFDGNNWKQLSTSSTITNVGAGASITDLTSTDIAFIDPTNDDLRTYRFGEIVGSQEFTDFLDNRFVNVDEPEIEITTISETAIPYGTTGAQALDLSTGTYFYPTAAAGSPAITFSFTNVGFGSPASRVYSFTLELSGAGDFAPTWPSSVKWPGGTEPTWTAAAGSPVVNGPDLVSFVTRDGGTTWFGMLGGLAFK
jgi:hypothetical protein